MLRQFAGEFYSNFTRGPRERRFRRQHKDAKLDLRSIAIAMGYTETTNPTLHNLLQRGYVNAWMRFAATGSRSGMVREEISAEAKGVFAQGISEGRRRARNREPLL